MKFSFQDCRNLSEFNSQQQTGNSCICSAERVQCPQRFNEMKHNENSRLTGFGMIYTFRISSARQMALVQGEERVLNASSQPDSLVEGKIIIVCNEAHHQQPYVTRTCRASENECIILSLLPCVGENTHTHSHIQTVAQARVISYLNVVQ